MRTTSTESGQQQDATLVTSCQAALWRQDESVNWTFFHSIILKNYLRTSRSSSTASSESLPKSSLSLDFQVWPGEKRRPFCRQVCNKFGHLKISSNLQIQDPRCAFQELQMVESAYSLYVTTWMLQQNERRLAESWSFFCDPVSIWPIQSF